jgi:hypothetical protein
VVDRVNAHFALHSAGVLNGAVLAKVKYVLTHPWRWPVLITCRPTGWHRNLSANKEKRDLQEHLTVDWEKPGGKHITTHHVYKTDGAYKSMCIK